MPNQYFNTRRAEPVISDLYSEYRNCNRWALIVGISRYQYQNWNLRYADRDAEEFYNLLLTPNGGKFQEKCICKLTNEQAKTGKITQALRSFLQKPAREDLVILYFACHGSPDPYRPDNLYLLTHDTEPVDIAGTALPMREVKQAVMENVHSKKVVILADTCHSGGISGGGRRNTADDSTLMNQYLQELSRAVGGIATFTSAEPRQVAQEGERWGGGHGVFTHYLLEGMRGAADRDGNGIITVGELFEYVRDRVKQDTDHRQHPLISSDGFDRYLPIAIAPNSNFSTTEGSQQQDNAPYTPRSEVRQAVEENLDVTQELVLMAAEMTSGTEKSVFTGQENITVKIPAGISPGKRIRVKGRGKLKPGTQQRGDLYLKLVERQQQTELEKRHELEQEKQRQEAEQQHQEREKIKYDNELRGYEQKFTKAVQRKYPLDQSVVDELKALQKKLQLKNEDITRVEQPIREIAEAKYQEKLKQQEQAEQRRKRWKQENRSLYEEMILTDEELDELIEEEEQSYILKIANLLVAEVRKKDGIDLSTDQNAMQRLSKAATEAKTELSKYQIAKISLPFLYTAIQAPQNVLQPQHLEGILIQTKTKELNFIDDYERFIWKSNLKDDDSGPANMYCIVGCALREQGNLKEAIAAYRKAIKLDPSLTIAHTRLEDVLKAQEQKAQEQKAQEQKKKFFGLF